MKAVPSLVIAAVTLTAAWHAATADTPRPVAVLPTAGPAEPGTITVQARVRHGDNTMTLPRVTLESGQPTTIQVDAVKLAILATTQKDGTVVIGSTLTTAADTAKPEKVAQIKVQVEAGKTAMIEVNEWEVTLTPTVNK